MRRQTLLSAGLVLALCAPADATEPGVTGTDTIFAYGFEDYILTIDNYLAWCSVSVDGGTAVVSPPPTPFAPGTVVALVGQPVSPTFIWGYWRFTDVAGHDTNQSTTVTMNSDRNVFVCCPFTNGSGCPAD